MDHFDITSALGYLQLATGQWVPQSTAEVSIANAISTTSAHRANTPLASELAGKQSGRSSGENEEDGGSEVECLQDGERRGGAGSALPSPLKRKVSFAVESAQVTKKLKSDDSSQTAEDLEATIAWLKLKVAKQTAEIDDLRLELDDVVDERSNLRTDLAVYQVEEERRLGGIGGREKHRKATDVALTVRLEKSLEEKWEKKLRRQKKKDEDRIAKNIAIYKQGLAAMSRKQAEQLRARDAANDEKGARNKEKLAKKAASMEEAEVEAKQSKEEYTRLMKELKIEQQEAIKKWKPEYSDTVKELDKAVKTKQGEITKLQDRCGDLQNELSQAKILEAALRKESDEFRVGKIDAEMKDEVWREQMQTVMSQIEATKSRHANQQDAWIVVLQSQAKKFDIQYDLAQQAMRDRIKHQRMCFDLKNANFRRDAQIKELMKEIQRLKNENHVLGSKAQASLSKEAELASRAERSNPSLQGFLSPLNEKALGSESESANAERAVLTATVGELRPESERLKPSTERLSSGNVMVSTGNDEASLGAGKLHAELPIVGAAFK